MTVAGGISEEPARVVRERADAASAVQTAPAARPAAASATSSAAGGSSTTAPGPRPSLWFRTRHAAAEFWTWALVTLSHTSPRFVQLVKPLFVQATWYASISIRRGTLANARRIFGPSSTRAQRTRMGKGVVANFYEFFAEVGRNSHRTREEMLVEVEQVIGHEKLVAARASGRGAVIAVAHMGSFEVATAALRLYEPSIHVVFKRDPRPHWERLRQSLHAKLGVHETPVDDGLGIWFHLRNRLAANEVVLIQADRVMPGQRGQRVPFLGGTLEVPTGPIKLAMAAGCPVIPVFAVRVSTADGPRVRIVIEDPIHVEGGLRDVGPGTGPHPALLRLTNLIARYVERYPDQWLLLSPAFVEDQPTTQPPTGTERA